MYCQEYSLKALEVYKKTPTGAPTNHLRFHLEMAYPEYNLQELLDWDFMKEFFVDGTDMVVVESLPIYFWGANFDTSCMIYNLTGHRVIDSMNMLTIRIALKNALRKMMGIDTAPPECIDGLWKSTLKAFEFFLEHRDDEYYNKNRQLITGPLVYEIGMKKKLETYNYD